MKNYRKILSIILTICMVMQILPVFGAEAGTDETVYGYIINDTFDSDVCGWVKGTRYGEQVTVTPDADNGILKVDLPGSYGNGTAWTDNDYQSTVTKVLETPIAFTGENLVRIKARVKAETEGGAYLIKVNRPDKITSSMPFNTFGNNVYAVAGFNEGTPVYGTGLSNGGGVVAYENNFKNISSATLLADGSTFNYTDVSLTDKWIDYTITINGATNEQWVEASFDDNNGQKVTVLSGSDSTFLQPADAYTKAGEEGASFAALNRLTFASKSTSAQTIYIDSVSVENIKIVEATAALASGKVIDKTEPVKVQFTSDDAISSVPAGAVAIEGVTSAESYDANTKTLTLTPSALSDASTYNVAFNTAKLAAAGIVVAEGTSLKFTTTGYVINDTFDNDVCGWVKGVGYNAVTLTPNAETGVVEVALPGANEVSDWAGTEKQSMITKAPEKSIAFTGENLVRIKARVKSNTGDAYLIKVNRPDTMGWNQIPLGIYNNHTYAVAGLMNGTPVYGSEPSGDYKNVSSAIYLANGSEFDYTDVSFADKWIDYTITINGATNEQWVEASFDNNGQKVTVVSGDNSTFLQPAAGYKSAGREGETTFDVFDRLTFTSRTTADQIIYIDSVSVENIKIPTAVETTVSLVSGKVIDKTETVKIQFTSEGKIESIPAGAVAIEGVTSAESYDGNTKTLTLTPSNLSDATTYNITFNTAKLEMEGIIIPENTNFSFTTTGYVINDTFDSDVCGWVKGVGYKAVTVTPNAETGIVEVALPGANAEASWAATENQSTITKAVGTPIAFTGENLVRIKARVKSNTGDAYLIKVNRPDTMGWNQIPLGVYNEHAYAVAGLKDGKPVYGSELTSSHKNLSSAILLADGTEFDYTDVSFADKWIDYTITINGATNEQWVEASFDNNGEIVTVLSGDNSTFSQSADAYKSAGREGETTFAAFERLTFASRTTADQTLYIDSVSVENIKITDDVKVTLASGKVIDKTEPVKVQFTSDDAISSVPEGAVAIEGVTSTENYDANTKTLTLTPSALSDASTYNVTFNTAKLAAAGIVVAEGTSLVFTTTGYVMNDMFDSNVCGWVKGVGYNAVTLTPNAETGVVEVALPGANEVSDWAGTEKQSMITKAPEKSIAFTGENLVRIKARVKSNTGDAYLIKVNRPDTMGWNQIPLGIYNNHTYAVAGLMNGKPVYGSEPSGDYKNVSSAIYLANGSEFDYTDVSFADKWIDYTITINGATNEQWVEASFDNNGQKITVVSGDNSTFSQPTAGYTSAGREGETTFAAFERLTFASRTTADQTIYIDSVSVENIKITEMKGQLLNGLTLGTDDAVKFQLLTDNAVTYVPDGAVVIEGVTSTQSYDPATKVITVTPVAPLTENNNYTVKVNAGRFAGAGIVYTGTASFTVKARGERITAFGTVFSDTFEDNTDETFSGWTPGVSKAGYAPTLNLTQYDGKNVLEVSYPATNANIHGGQGTIRKEIGNGIEYTGNNIVRVKAKVLAEAANDFYLFKINRPDAESQVYVNSHYGFYTMAGYYNNSLIYGSTPDNVNTPTWKSHGALTYNTDGSLNDSEDKYNIAGKWVDYTITFDGSTNKMTVKAEYTDDNGNLVSLTTTEEEDATVEQPFTALEREYGKGTNIKTYNAFESLSLESLDHGGAVKLYIDSISVENIEKSVEVNASFKVNGTTADTFGIGDTVIPEFELTPNSSVTSFAVVSAMYVDGKLHSTHINTVDTTKKTTYTEADGYVIPEGNEVVVKAFVWNGVNSMIPIGKAAKAELEESLTIYVSKSGSDDNTGAEDAPVASLAKALEKAKYNKEIGYTDRIIIRMGEGSYDISEPVMVTGGYVPEGGLKITEVPGENATLVGGVSFDIADAQLLDDTTDAAVIAKLKSGVDKTKVYKLNLKSKVSSIPAVSFPGAWGMNNIELLRSLNLENPATATCEAAIDGKLLTVARWPDNGYANAGTVVTAGFIGENATTQAEITQGFTISTDYENISNWPTNSDVLMFGYWGHNWAPQTLPLGAVGNGTITSKYASYYGVKQGARYYVYNLIEEMDKPGEYYIDRNNGFMYFYKPDYMTENSKLSLSTVTSAPLRIENTSNVVVDGLDVTMACGNGISIKDCNNVLVQNCNISNTGDSAIDLRSKNSTVKNCVISDVNGGIYAVPEAEDAEAALMNADEEGSTATNNQIINNKITNFSRLNKAYRPAIDIGGIGTVAANNDISHGEHIAIRYSGLDHTIKNNEVSYVCKETDDAGAIYIGRSWVNRGTKIVNNYFHDIASSATISNPVAAIFLDDHSAGAYIEGNIFEGIDGDGVRGNGGREHTITNNIFVDCTLRAVYMPDNNYDAATAESNYETQINGAKKYKDLPYWQKRFPLLYKQTDGVWAVNVDGMRMPAGHTFTYNFMTNCSTDENVTENGYHYGSKATELVSVNGITKGDVISDTNPFGGNYSDNASKTGITGFNEIDFGAIGRK